MNFFSQEQLFVIFIINLSLIAYIRYTNTGFIKKYLFAVPNYNTAQQIQKSEINKKSVTNFLLSLNFYISVNVFIIFILSRFNLLPKDINPFFIFLFTFIIIFLIIYLNAAVNFISAFIFDLKHTALCFHRNNKIVYHTFGIILIIINILIAFSPVSKFAFNLGIILAGIFYLLRIFRYIKINLSEQVNIFYLFLYLCAVEIFPIIYIIKIFTLFYTTTN